VSPSLRTNLGKARRRLAGAPPPAALRASGPKPEPGTLDYVFERERLDNENMRRLVAFSLAADDCCVDIGAHRGALLEEIVRVAPAGHHLAYEPLPNLAAELRTRFPNVDVRQAAVSNHVGTATFHHVRGVAEGCSGFQVVTAPAEYTDDVVSFDVALERLDDALAEVPEIALIKIDVEGAEQQVFEGAHDALARSRPIVLFEHAYAASSAYGTEPRHIYDFLCDEIGLRVFDLDGNGPFTSEEFALRSQRADPVNYVAHR
jgi:FkbM family methyltransferase